MKRNPVLLGITDLFLPPIWLFALYVQFHGDYGPGGGFQAGVIFAAGVILYALIHGVKHAQRIFSPGFVQRQAALGVLIYGAVGVASLFQGGGFLNYSVLQQDPLHGQHLGIMLVELGVGLTVAAVMIAIFYAFAGRGRRDSP